MGLNERRKIKELQETTLPARVKDIEEIWLIKLRNVKDRAGMRMSFEGGVLEMHFAYALRTGGMHGDGAIRCNC